MINFKFIILKIANTNTRELIRYQKHNSHIHTVSKNDKKKSIEFIIPIFIFKLYKNRTSCGIYFLFLYPLYYSIISSYENILFRIFFLFAFCVTKKFSIGRTTEILLRSWVENLIKFLTISTFMLILINLIFSLPLLFLWTDWNV